MHHHNETCTRKGGLDMLCKCNLTDGNATVPSNPCRDVTTNKKGLTKRVIRKTQNKTASGHSNRNVMRNA